jgi:hypothetical protein
MVDATIVPVPEQRNSRKENEVVKVGKTPQSWEANPAKNRQKDKDARWTKKHGTNRQKRKIRARVEHVFGAQQTSPGGRLVRTIGIMRAKAKIGLQNLAYNIRRLVTLERFAAA